jgi:putative colanic acid biosysnthesis UDP-glucose lipid carrier transferase
MFFQLGHAAASARMSTRKQNRLAHDAIAPIAAMLDFVFVLLANAIGAVSYQKFAFGLYPDPETYVGIGLVMAALFVLAMSSAHAYRHESLISLRHQAFLIILIVPGVLAFLLTVIFFLKLGTTFSRGATLSLALTSIVGLMAMRFVWRHRLPQALAKGFFRQRKAVLIAPATMQFGDLDALSATNGIAVAHVLRFGECENPAAQMGANFLKLFDGKRADEVIVLWQDAPTQELESLLAALRRWPLPVRVIFDNFTGSVVSCSSENIAGKTAFQVQRPPLSLGERVVKRSFDISFSLLALGMLAPMLIIVALVVKLDSRGPALFRQSRKGHGGTPFQILKFRSMTVMENGSDVRQAVQNDVRVTRVGRFIRSLSIDELPQFWNVLRGEMSVVGPRPHAIAHDDLYDRLISDYAARRHVKPGLTGWAQVNGYRGETATVEVMERRVNHDLWYIDNWSFWFDCEIVLRTLFKLRSQV